MIEHVIQWNYCDDRACDYGEYKASDDRVCDYNDFNVISEHVIAVTNEVEFLKLKLRTLCGRRTSTSNRPGLN